MKIFKKNPLVFLALALIFVLTMSFTTNVNEILQSDQMTLTNSNMIVDGNDNKCCCPPNWFLTPLLEDDPAEKWDNNRDGWICFKSEGIGNDTPHGNGNDPLFDQSNVKDNNNPCDDDEFNTCDD